MKIAVVYTSYFHKNTEGLAKAIANDLGGELFPLLKGEAPADLQSYDVFAIGSGVYVWKLHERMTKWIEGLPVANENQGVILFTTSATKNQGFHKHAIDVLEEKGYTILGEYQMKAPLRFRGLKREIPFEEMSQNQGYPSFIKHIKKMLEMRYK